jgi:DNA mismatch repair protein MutS
MYDKYRMAYKHYSSIYGADTVIFYMVGKFYEMYDWIDSSTGLPGTTIKRAADLLGIQLSTREGKGPAGTDALFAGVPEQSLHKYATVLTRQNWTVVVFDQVKDTKGDIKERVVTRILSPGTHIESATQDSVYIAGIWLEEGAWGSRAAPAFGLVALDLTTGCITTYEGSAAGKDDSWAADDALHFFQVHPPRECITWWKGAPATRPGVDTLRRQFGLLSSKIHVEQADNKMLEMELVREEFLRRAIPVRSLLPFREALQIAGAPKVERALCALLNRLEDMYPSGSAVRSLHCPSRWNPESSLFLGNQALLQLNMITPRMEDSILGLFQRTQTTFGRRAMRNRILFPVASATTLKSRYEEIEFIGRLETQVSEKLERRLQTIGDLPRLHRRITAGQVTAADVCELDMSYICVEHLLATFKGTCLEGPASPPVSLNTVFSTVAAKQASEDSFCFQRGRVPAVDELEGKIREAHTTLANCLEEVTRWAGVPEDSLRLEFRDVVGPGITGTKAIMTIAAKALKGAAAAPYSGIHLQQKKSSSSLEVPFLQKTWGQILSLRGQLQEAVRTALPALCDELTAANLAAWDAMEEWVAKVDITYTIWRVSKEHRFVQPKLLDGDHGAVRIGGLRHPLIEGMVTRTEYVRHDVELDTTGWLVYGMNASGKSSLMKAVGIATLLAQAGCYVPAAKFEFTPFRSLFTRILNTDNLWAGLSSFAVEMTELREILDRADHWSLVLGDEVCSGTESVSATSLVAASIRWLHERRAAYIFATHLHGLGPFVETLPRLRTWHLKVRYDPVADRLIYERTLTPGSGSSLYGLEVARAMNLPERILQEAAQIRKELLGEGAASSSWNSALERRVCELCKSPILKELEVHHIRGRREADEDGYFSDGSHQDDVRNLIVVCQACHDNTHAGGFTIPPVVQTSDGPMRIVSAAPAATKKSKWSEEQLGIIREYLAEFPKVNPKRAVFDLEQRGIFISQASLKTMRLEPS